MAIIDLFKKASSILNDRLTDELFLIIQDDKRLMHEYLRLVESEGLDTVNKNLGKLVKTHYKMTNSNKRKKDPKSTLILSHQIFK
jgi:hypothetical protein